MKNTLDDIKDIRNYILGVISFATAVSTFLITVFHFELEKTVISVAFIAVLMLVVGWLIRKSEQRQKALIEKYKAEQINERDKAILEFKEDVDSLKNSVSNISNIVKNTRQDTVRIQLNDYMKDQPENIDTILKLAEEYFVKLGGDWYMTSEFQKWAKAHDIAIPQIITNAIIKTESESQL